MKLKQLTMACAAALVSGQVFAHAPGTVADETIWISGASAQDKALKALVGNTVAFQDFVTHLEIEGGERQRAFQQQVVRIIAVGVVTRV